MRNKKQHWPNPFARNRRIQVFEPFFGWKDELSWTVSGLKLVNMFGVSVKITSSLVISIDFHFLGHWMSFPEEHKDKNCTPLSSSIIANDILTRIFNFHTRNWMNRITSVDPATNYSSSTAMREPLRNPIGSKWSRRHPKGFKFIC